MAQFSGAVKLADLNDFIAPSQACVVNFNGSKDGSLQIDNKAEITGAPEVPGYMMTCSKSICTE